MTQDTMIYRFRKDLEGDTKETQKQEQAFICGLERMKNEIFSIITDELGEHCGNALIQEIKARLIR